MLPLSLGFTFDLLGGSAILGGIDKHKPYHLFSPVPLGFTSYAGALVVLPEIWPGVQKKMVWCSAPSLLASVFLPLLQKNRVGSIQASEYGENSLEES